MTARLFIFLPMVFFNFAGCSKIARTDDDVYEEFARYYNELADTLTKVMDEKSAKDTMPRIKTIDEKLIVLKERMDQIQRDGPAPRVEALKKKYESTIYSGYKRLINQYLRLLRLVPSAKDTVVEVKATLKLLGATVPQS